ncbi:hypothetical protein LX36DRAFT_234082 [Colletotrichum falcatum]|nr:hypothetical protein LX36DRAFT_234082 [Colletotrichum falcatum]
MACVHSAQRRDGERIAQSLLETGTHSLGWYRPSRATDDSNTTAQDMGRLRSHRLISTVLAGTGKQRLCVCRLRKSKCLQGRGALQRRGWLCKACVPGNVSVETLLSPLHQGMATPGTHLVSYIGSGGGPNGLATRGKKACHPSLGVCGLVWRLHFLGEAEAEDCDGVTDLSPNEQVKEDASAGELRNLRVFSACRLCGDGRL